MALEIFPVSPLPANTTRIKRYNANVARYDSGARQAFSNWSKPLYEWSVPFKNFNETKQNTLNWFYNNQFGPVNPFLMKDPYDFRVNSVLVASAGYTDGATLYVYDTFSYYILVDTTTIGSLSSALSGYVTLGQEYQYDQDTGILTANSIDGTDVWTAQSLQYFRKVAFKDDYSDTSPVWNIFNSNIVIEEMV